VSSTARERALTAINDSGARMGHGAAPAKRRSSNMDMALTADFWIGLLKIIWINVILSGDNAVVIALAARTLPAHQQTKAVALGSSAAVVLRVLLTVVAAKLMTIAFLQIVGGLLLLWIGFKLLLEEGGDGEEGVAAHTGTLLAAVRTILVADLIMSLDNVIAVAAAANGNMVLLILGLAISIPLVVFGSTLLIKLMERFPAIVTIGAGLIGWVAGEAIVGDAALAAVASGSAWLHYAGPALGAAVVVLGARLLQPAPALETIAIDDR
jgi:YjbE family integral membrane protein